MGRGPSASQAEPMLEDAREFPLPGPHATFTRAEFDALVAELQDLRTRRRQELARRLRDARDGGSPGDNDDVLGVLEEVSIEEARIAQLEELVRAAPIAEFTDDGLAAVGCTVRVQDPSGDTVDFRIVGRRADDAGRHDVTPGSPVGRALLGATAGDDVRVELPSGRVRPLRVLRVWATPPGGRPAA